MSGKGIKVVFRIIALLVILVCVVSAVIWWFNSRKPATPTAATTKTAEEEPKALVCAVVSNAVDTIVNIFAPDDSIRLDVRKMTCAQFAKQINFLSPTAILWMPGEGDWVITGARNGSSNTVENIVYAFAEQDCPLSLPDLFSSYVGTMAEIRPAFAALDADAMVLPELFVSRDLPELSWLGNGEIDEADANAVRLDIKSAMLVRRLILNANIDSRKGKTDAALEAWAAAYKSNPHDTFLTERIEHLNQNARVFRNVSKYAMAASCFETILCINPADYVATVNFATCLQQIGRKEMAEVVFKRAEMLRPDADPLKCED